MKNWGLFLLLGGIVLCIISLSMDTSVEVPETIYGSGEYKVTTKATRVNNLGLMKDQQNYVIFTGIIAIIGALMFFFGKNPVNKYSEYVKYNEFKQCPQCAEQVKAEAKICRFCKYEFADIQGDIDWEELALKVNETKKEKDLIDGICKHCKSELTLSESELKEKKFICPECGKENDISKIITI